MLICGEDNQRKHTLCLLAQKYVASEALFSVVKEVKHSLVMLLDVSSSVLSWRRGLYKDSNNVVVDDRHGGMREFLSYLCFLHKLNSVSPDAAGA
jgi:hypothetical protein